MNHKLFISLADVDPFYPKYFILDNDFLSALHQNAELRKGLIEKFPDATYLIDPLIEFEFLRDNYLPSTLKDKVEFIKTLCVQVENHPEILKQLSPIAQNLSKIMAHKGLAGQASYVDLHVGARVLKYGHNAAIITGNNRHYPDFIFN